MNITGLNYIGVTPSGSGTVCFQPKDPFTGKTLHTTFKEATNGEISNAVDKAEGAFQRYRSKSAEERALFLEAIADEIMALGDTLIKCCMAETALPYERLIGERGRTINQLKLFASVVREGSWADIRIDTALPDRKPLPKPDIRQMHIPLGPVGIFGASNFPFAFSVAGGDTASALAAGCPVVLKAHPLHPGTSELVGRAILTAAQKTTMPDGVFSLIQGTSVTVGMAIVMHPQITAIGFTGSFKGGKAIFDAANQRPVPIPVFAEMGSTNPVFILPEALRERKNDLAKGFYKSLSLGVGQFCTNPGLLITETTKDVDHFLNLLSEEVRSATPGTMLGDSIKQNYQYGVARLQESNGVTLMGSSAVAESEHGVSSYVFSTTADIFIKDQQLAEEVFGPTTLHVATADKVEMLNVAAQLGGHLTATIIGTENELKQYQELIAILERKVGRLLFNGYPTGVEVCPAMVHGGPFPATTALQTTSVGTAAIRRFARPICFQDFPQTALPEALRDSNPLKITRMINGKWTTKAL